jgi:RHS repeat-associated protein
VTEADGSVVTYGYDGLLHLSSEVRTGTNPYSASYTVDGAGQRTSETVGGVTTSFTYDADAELLSTSGGFVNSYVYDLDGEQTSRKLSGVTTVLTWDFDNQLTSAGSASFTYDATGRRMSRTNGGVTTSFLYDGDEILLEKQGTTTTATYTYGNALVRKDGETPLFDGLGSERTVTNTTGAVQGTLTETAFGQSVASTGSSTDPYEFAATSGYRNDGDAGLMLVGARYYDAQTGIFISRDTYLDEDPYVYCDGDPVNELDPSGHGAPFKPGPGGWGKMFKGIMKLLGPIGKFLGGGSVHYKGPTTTTTTRTPTHSIYEKLPDGTIIFEKTGPSTTTTTTTGSTWGGSL